MSLWPTDDHGTILGVLGGLIVLVFVGVMTSLLIERRSKASASGTELHVEIARDQEIIGELTAKRNSLEKRWQEKKPITIISPETLAALQTDSEDRSARIISLKRQIQSLQQNLEAIQSESIEYQRRYRLHVRAGVVGERIADLELPSGRRYADVVIRKFDAEGIEIQHEGGSARITYADLPDSWKVRLHWDPSEKKPTPPKAKPIPAKVTPDEIAPSRDPEADESEKQQAKIRESTERMIRYHGEYREANLQAATARSKAFGSERSVPGSLETWEERAARMERVAAKAYSLFRVARSDLATLSPGHPLLHDATLR